MLKFNEHGKQDIFELEALVHKDAMYGLALKLTRNEKDAEDLVQDSLIKAYRHFDKYELGTNCRAWLLKILTNAFINRYRKQQREQTYVMSDENVDAESIPAVESKQHHFYTPGKEQHQFSDEVLYALKNIPEDFRQVVIMADLEDYSYKEIAEIINRPIGTVMSRLFRGRKMLQKLLTSYAKSYGYRGSAA